MVQTTVFSLLLFVGPMLVVKIVVYIELSKENDSEIGRILLTLFSAKILGTTLTILVYFRSHIIGQRIKSVLDAAIYRKALKFSLLRTSKYSPGDLVNLLLVDTHKIFAFIICFRGMISLPLLLCCSVMFMYIQVGNAYLSGFLVIGFFGYFGYLTSRSLSFYDLKVDKCKDARMKITNEIFNNIKVIKLNAWEGLFSKKINGFYSKEADQVINRSKAECLTYSTMMMAPNFITLSVFGFYSYFHQAGIDTTKAFALISAFFILQNPLREFSMFFIKRGEAMGCIRRIQRFLVAEEVDTSHITHSTDTFNNPYALTIQNGNFYWVKDKYQNLAADQDNSQKTQVSVASSAKTKLPSTPISAKKILTRANKTRGLFQVLEDIEMKVQRGRLVGILGKIGSGKSSLINSLIGETIVLKDGPSPSKTRIFIQASLSLVSQQPWIQNATVKNNILFGKPFNKRAYMQAIQYACLKDDLLQFQDGDETMIGEKGATLSGGQRLRISLARALYQDRQLIIFDDPLSALDAHVGKFIFKETICNYLRDKTRILVTHALYFAKDLDYIYLFDHGAIHCQGTLSAIETTALYKEISLQ